MSDLLDIFKQKRGKYGLPEFSELDRHFDLVSIDNYDALLRSVRHRMTDKLDFFAKIIEGVLQPNESLSSLHEYKLLEDKKELYDTYRSMMGLIRNSHLLELDSTEEDDAEFIKDSFSRFSKMLPVLRRTLEELQGCWSKDALADDSPLYFG